MKAAYLFLFISWTSISLGIPRAASHELSHFINLAAHQHGLIANNEELAVFVDPHATTPLAIWSHYNYTTYRYQRLCILHPQMAKAITQHIPPFLMYLHYLFAYTAHPSAAVDFFLMLGSFFIALATLPDTTGSILKFMGNVLWGIILHFGFRWLYIFIKTPEFAYAAAHAMGHTKALCVEKKFLEKKGIFGHSTQDWIHQWKLAGISCDHHK